MDKAVDNGHSIQGNSGHEGRGFDFQQALGLVRRHWKTFVATSMLGLLMGMTWIVLRYPVYTATTMLLIDARKQKVLRSEAMMAEPAQLDGITVGTELSLIRSIAIAHRVAERLKLENDADFNGPPSRNKYMDELYSLLGWTYEAPRDTHKARDAADAIAAVQRGMRVDRINNTWLFNISFTHSNPKVAARLANSFADTYLAEKLEAQYEAARKAAVWLREKAAAVREQVEASERAVTEQRVKYNLTSQADGRLPEASRQEQAVIRLRDLERQTQADRGLYESLLSRLKEVEQQTSLPTSEARVIVAAAEPDKPSNFSDILVLAICGLGGLAAGIGLTLLREHLESGFTTLEQLEKALSLPVLAMLPHSSQRERVVNRVKLSIPEFVARRPLSRFSEHMRSIRLGVQSSNGDQPPRVILITSSVSSEGKSTISQGIAYSAAAAGQRVLLVDCDLRHRALSVQYGRPEGPGLTNLLTGSVPREQVFCNDRFVNLNFLSAGTIAGHQPDVLSSPKLRALLGRLRESYDLIVLDAPPVTPVIDSILLSKLADKLIFVVQWKITPRDVVTRAVNAFGEAKYEIYGIVVNRVRMKDASTYSNLQRFFLRTHEKYYA